jgi:dihydroflavonol-4-reductase
VDTRDVVKAAISALHNGAPGECYLIAGKYRTLIELSKTIGEVTKKKTPTLILPMWVVKLLLPFINLYSKISRTEPLYTDESLKALEEGNKHIVYKKAAEQLGHHPRPLKETIADSYEWFKGQGLTK